MENISVITLTQGRRILNPDGTTNISCRQCGRIVAKAHNPPVSSISHCAICLGSDPEHVLAQYYQQSPMHAPIPRIAIEKDVTTMYDDEDIKTNHGKFGWLRPLFKVVSWLSQPVEATAEVSKAVAKRKKRKGLLEPYKPEAQE